MTGLKKINEHRNSFCDSSVFSPRKDKNKVIIKIIMAFLL